MKQIKCRDLGHACAFEATGPSVDDVLQQAGKHAVEHHGMTVTPEVVEAVKSKIQDK